MRAMMRGWRQQYHWWVVILALIWGHGLWAAQKVTDLYQTTISVAGQGDEERTTAFRAALTEVITRVSGRKNKAAASVHSPEDLVASYRYEPGTNGLQLVVDFEPTAINRLLGKYDVPVWQGRRPSTLVWLVEQASDGTTHLVGSDGPSPYQIPLQEEAKRRGVPLVWPIMDLLDPSSLPLNEGKKGALLAALRDASRNYPVDAVWVGRLAPRVATTPATTEVPEGKGALTAHWTLIRGSAEEQWDTTGTEPAAILIAGVDKLADRLAANASTPGGGVAVQVVVVGIVSLDGYAQLRTYLENLSEVARIWPTHLAAEGRVTFVVETRGSTTDLTAVLDRTGLLRAEKSPLDLSTLGNSTLYYRFLPFQEDNK
ncbi:conserved hypothetical protein [Gammaproteobacteria bacterium]